VSLPFGIVGHLLDPLEWRASDRMMGFSALSFGRLGLRPRRPRRLEAFRTGSVELARPSYNALIRKILSGPLAPPTGRLIFPNVAHVVQPNADFGIRMI